jgi:CheY-like chemotaxis protein
VLNQLHVTPKMVGASDDALALMQSQEFDVIIVDWREIDSLGEFVSAVRRSKLNADCVLVAIVRDLLDMWQAFAAGVHFLIHKPASLAQIERCLRAAYCATVARRRKQHREPVNIVAAISTRVYPFAEMTVVNLSEGGAGLRMAFDAELGAHLSVADEVELVDNFCALRRQVRPHSGRGAPDARAVAYGVRGAFAGGGVRAVAGGVRLIVEKASMFAALRALSSQSVPAET